MDHQRTGIAVPTLGYSKQDRLPTGRSLPWDKAQKGCQITTGPKVRDIRDGTIERRGRDNPDSGDGQQGPADRIRTSKVFEFLIDLRQPGADRLVFINQRSEERARDRAEPNLAA